MVFYDNDYSELKTLQSHRKSVAEQVKDLRYNKRVQEAIECCVLNLRDDESNKILRNILSDIYLQNGDLQRSASALIDNLKYINASKKDLRYFATRFFRMKKLIDDKAFSSLKEKVLKITESGLISNDVAIELKKLIDKDTDPKEIISPLLTEFRVLSSRDSKFKEFTKFSKRIEFNSSDSLIQLLNTVILHRARSVKYWMIDFHCVSIYEKYNYYSNAIDILQELLGVKIQPVAVRALLRICRLQNNYYPAEILFESNPQLLRADDFNILYELIYYFEYQDDIHSAQTILRHIKKGFSENLPALRTARNFYIRFGMVDEVRELNEIILRITKRNPKVKGKFNYEAQESESSLVSKIQELHSQLEHQKQLAAISDLTTGISHELGQPLTNIRYTIQFYRRKLEADLDISIVEKVFQSILEETERMGGLIRRLSPLTSSRGTTEPFDLYERIDKRVKGESPRLVESGINVVVKYSSKVIIFCDPVKFDQLISNLLLNAIDAINESNKKSEKEINIMISENVNDVSISFADTGVGIPVESRNKIFDPFYSTKAPGQGEGLGLFIVWNILKMLGGRIFVDAKYKGGAKFVLTLPKNKSNEVNDK